MLCRYLRYLSSYHISIALTICVATSGLSFMVTPPVLPSEEETPTITLHSPEPPWAAVSQASGVRLEKQAQTGRVSLQKPVRSAHLATTSLHQMHSQQPRPHQVARHLPRRLLPAQRFTLRSSGDSGDPYLS